MNNTTKTLIRYEAKAFLRNKFQLVLLALIMAIGLYAIYAGISEINSQKDTIKTLIILEQEEFRAYKNKLNNQTTSEERSFEHQIASSPAFAWYRHGYHAFLPPRNLAPLAIGQRDLFRYYYRLTGMSLYYQLFENELANPVNLMTGNLDLAFVIIYLFPLLIIAFCYGLYSNEKERGTLSLLSVQAVSIRRIMTIKLLFYFILVTSMAITLSVVGVFSSGVCWTADFFLVVLSWLLVVSAYCAFWFALLYLITSLLKSSAFNAMFGAGCWLMFIIIIPALLNILVVTKYPLSSTTLAGLTRRTGLENEDDEEESKEIIMEYLALKPEMKGCEKLIRNNIIAKAYASYTTLKDIKSRAVVTQYDAQVARRAAWAAKYSWFSPAVFTNEALVNITGNNLDEFLQFQESLSDFHSEIKEFYFSRLFWDKSINLDDYRNIPVYSIPKEKIQWVLVLKSLGITALLAVTLFVIGFFKMGKGVS